MRIKGHTDVVPSGSVHAAMFALWKHGPLSVAIDASHRSFVFYANGVYYEPQCGELGLVFSLPLPQTQHRGPEKVSAFYFMAEFFSCRVLWTLIP